MEISEREFHRAILAYFEKLHKEVGRVGWTADNIERVTKELQGLVAMESKTKGREEVMVHIGHTFGPFGLKIK